MVPDLDLQLQTVIKALSDVVMPALDAEQKMAAEQLGLSIATLHMVRARLPYDARRASVALSHAIALGREIAPSVNDAALDGAIAEGAEMLRRNDASPRTRDEATARLNAQISRVAAAPSTAPDVLRMIVTGSQPSLDLARAWCMPGGFEPHPETVPALETLLGAASS